MLEICSLGVLILHELLVPVLIYGSDTMLWKEDRSRIRAEQMDNLRRLLDIRRMDRIKGKMKGLMKACSGGSTTWKEWRMIGFPREYVKVCAGSRSVGRPWKRWIDTVKVCLKNRDLDVRQVRRMVQYRCKW